MRKKIFSYIIILFVLVLVTPLTTQESTGRIIGKIVDTVGNPIPGVRLTLIASTGKLMQAFTNVEGSFQFLTLPPAKGYTLKAERVWFETKTETDISVGVGETIEINLVMEAFGKEFKLPDLYRPRSGQHKQMKLTKEQIEAFRSAKTVRIVVEQSYQDNKDKELKHVRLPLDYVTARFLKLLGLQVLRTDDKNYDIEIEIIAKGSPGVRYYKGSHHASQLKSTISFEVPNTPIYSVTMYTYDDVRPEKISEPITAKRNPFAVSGLVLELMNSFEVNIIELMVEIFGISALTERLNDKNVATRKHAAESLCYIKDKRSVEPLISALDDKDDDVRMVVIKALGDKNDPRAVEPLKAALKDEDKDIRIAAVNSLRYYIEDSRAVEALLACLKDEEGIIRAAALEILVQPLSYQEAFDITLEALRDKDEIVRAAALETLIWELDGTEAENLLIAALKDKAELVRAIVVEYIFYWLDDDQRAAEYSLAALTDKSDLVRASAAKSFSSYVGDAGDEPLEVEPLIACLKDKNEDVRIAAACSLSEFCDEPQVVGSLITALKDANEFVRAAAARSLCYSPQDQRKVEPLINCLNDKKEVVRAAVLDALRYSDDLLVVEALISVLKDKDENFRMYVDEVLETITSNSFDGNQKKWKKWWVENREKFIKDRRI